MATTCSLRSLALLLLRALATSGVNVFPPPSPPPPPPVWVTTTSGLEDYDTTQGILTLDDCKAACLTAIRCYAISWADEGSEVTVAADEGSGVTCKLKSAATGDPEGSAFTTYVRPLECCSTVTIRRSASADADGA